MVAAETKKYHLVLHVGIDLNTLFPQPWVLKFSRSDQMTVITIILSL